MQWKKIGSVHSNFTEPADPFVMKKHESMIEIGKEWEEGLYRLEDNEYLQVIFHFHQAAGFQLKGPTYSGEVKGVFASRSPRRPTPIGLTLVKLLERNGRWLRVRGLDAIDGTPVVDIKPFVPHIEWDEEDESAEMQYRKNPRFEIMKMIRANDLGRLLMRAGELHGHYCPGLAMGVMAGSYAVRKLGWESEGMEKVLAIVETNSCFADGVQITTGCTFGNNSLIYRDIGKTALVVTRRNGKGLRLAAKPHPLDDPDYHQLFEKVIKNRQGTDEEKARFWRQAMKRAFLVLDKEISELFTVEKIAVKVPDYAPIHDSITCDSCKEPVISTRIIEIEGQHLCRTCAHLPYAELTGSGIGMNDI